MEKYSRKKPILKDSRIKVKNVLFKDKQGQKKMTPQSKYNKTQG